MGECCYTIEQVPDLTLGKYDYLSHNGVDGVLELHRTLLRQLHEKSYLTDTTFHLLYYYQHDGAPGSKIKIFFLAKGPEQKLANVEKLLNGSSLSEYFTFSFLYREDDQGNVTKLAQSGSALRDLIRSKTFSCCNSLTKEEVFLEARNGKHYYNVPAWTPNDEGRLYDMFRMMDTLGEDFAYRIDIRAAKRNRTLREKLTSGPISQLHALQGTSAERDYSADSMLRGYEDVLKKLDSQPHFEANVFVFSNNSEDGSMILAAAASEAIQNGDYTISSFPDQFHCRSLLDSEPQTYYSTTNDFVLKYDGSRSKTYSSKLEDIGWLPLYYLSTLYTLDELEPLFRLPCLHDGEHIEIRKETVAPTVTGDQVLYLGLDSHGYEVNIPLDLLPKHAFLSGVPGSGKTNAMHHITHSLWTQKQPIPFLVLEPAKKEYRALLNLPEMQNVRLFSPCSDMSFPLHINPFEFAKGLSVSEHIRTLCSVFEGAFPLTNPMPFLLENAIEKVYSKMGWRPETRYTDKTNREFPTMSMLYEELERELDNTTYSGEVRGNLESALKVRIGSLLRREMGDVFDVQKSSLTPEEWLTTPAIVELESMGAGPANFTTLMLCALIREVLKVNPTFDGPVRHVIFIEEAHNLIGPDSEEKIGDDASPKTAATAFIVKMLAEVRALKEGIFIADQLPTAMAQEVIKNTGLKIALRLTAMDDRQLLCNSMSANSSQIEAMGNFKIGQALVSYEKLQRPFTMRVNLWCGDREEEERKRLATSLPDAILASNLSQNSAHLDNLYRSVAIEFKKLKAPLLALIGRAEACLETLGQHEEVTARCARVLQESNELSVRLVDILTFRHQADLHAAFQDEEYAAGITEQDRLSGEILQCNIDSDALVEELKSQRIGALLVDIMNFSTTLEHKIAKFQKLGIGPTEEDFRLYSEDPYQLPPHLRSLCAARLNVLQGLFDLGTRIYNHANAIAELSDNISDNVGTNFAKLAATFKITPNPD